MASYIIVAIIAYAIGSINFSVIISKKMAGFDRGITHYLKYVVEDGNVMHLPDLDKFIQENTFKLLDFKTLGTYAHLIEDKIWFEKFVGKYIKWQVDMGERLLNVFIKRINEF